MDIPLKSGHAVKLDYVRGNKKAPWEPSGRCYEVTIKTGRKSKVGRRSYTFDFWGSRHDMETGKGCDLRGAAACFASDAMIARFEEWEILEGCKGNDIPRIIKGCQESDQAAVRLGLTDGDLQELADY